MKQTNKKLKKKNYLNLKKIAHFDENLFAFIMHKLIVDTAQIQGKLHGQAKRIEGSFPFDDRFVLFLRVVGKVELLLVRSLRRCD